MALMVLHHGTDIESAKAICGSCGIDLSRCSDKTDFGKGFYTTDNFEVAVNWAKRKARVRTSRPAVVTLWFDAEAAQNMIEHFSDDLRWGRFVINNRNGLNYIRKVSFKDNNLDSRYHITCGRVADINVVNIADELNKSGSMLNSIEDIFNANYPQQTVFHTLESLGYIKKKSYRSV